MVEPVKFVETKDDLCKTCHHGFKGGCPIFPPLNITRTCVEYRHRNRSPVSKK